MKSIPAKLLLILKKIVRPIVWELLYYRDRFFSPKAEKVRFYNRMVKKGNIFFTTSVNINGFTDQLIGLIFLYKIGHWLGLKYHFTPLISNRSTPVSNLKKKSKVSEPFSDIYDFLGVNSYLKKESQSLPKKCKEVEIDLDKMVFEKRTMKSFNALLLDLKSKLVEYIPEEESVLFRLKGSSMIFQLYSLTTPFKEWTLPLRKFYLKERKNVPWESRFDQNKVNLLIHIRQGDTSIIKTPWNTFIGLSYKIQKRYTQQHSKEEVNDYEVIDVNLYYKFLQELFTHLYIQDFSTAVFSDGFKRAFKIILADNSSVNVTDEHVQQLKELEKVYDQQQFKKFYGWDEIKTSVGEEKEKLFDLIQSFFESDIIIFGTQAKLIPKLIAIYSNPKKMPFIINLYNEKHPHIDYLGIDHSSDQVLFVDINNYDISQIANSIKIFIARKR